jgi:hypothetical protein
MTDPVDLLDNDGVNLTPADEVAQLREVVRGLRYECKELDSQCAGLLLAQREIDKKWEDLFLTVGGLTDKASEAADLARRSVAMNLQMSKTLSALGTLLNNLSP